MIQQGLDIQVERRVLSRPAPFPCYHCKKSRREIVTRSRGSRLSSVCHINRHAFPVLCSTTLILVAPHFQLCCNSSKFATNMGVYVTYHHHLYASHWPALSDHNFKKPKLAQTIPDIDIWRLSMRSRCWPPAKLCPRVSRDPITGTSQPDSLTYGLLIQPRCHWKRGPGKRSRWYVMVYLRTDRIRIDSELDFHTSSQFVMEASLFKPRLRAEPPWRESWLDPCLSALIRKKHLGKVFSGVFNAVPVILEIQFPLFFSPDNPSRGRRHDTSSPWFQLGILSLVA
jgi:hypothetical protein